MIDHYLDPFEDELDLDNERVDLNDLRDQLEGVLYQMYKGGDVFMMESHLDEMAYLLGMKIPLGDPVLEKKS